MKAICVSLRREQPKHRLKVVLLTRNALGFTLGDNLLAEPLLLEAVVESLKILNNVPASADDGVFGGDGAIGLDAELEGSEERVGHLVRGEADVVVLEEALGEQVAERMILLVEGEDGGIRDACYGRVRAWWQE